jgi:hypothetical protein
MEFDRNLNIMDGLTRHVIDEDSDDEVGNVVFKKGVGREVTLYGRYKGTFKTHEECVAFIKGVETVLEHMIG